MKTEKILLVPTGSRWGKGKFGTVIRIVQKLSETAGVEFAGAVIRPHTALMRHEGKLTEAGRAVLKAARAAGRDLVQKGTIRQETLAEFSHPLIPEDDLRSVLNQIATA